MPLRQLHLTQSVIKRIDVNLIYHVGQSDKN
ncbi:hypothetical protein T07_6424 [Trichinella nelsoni]|uniref:Uncharacterized protein n=1 Tax=Trichinella nelsoni TaxID=6336 RepID=A0A0V0RCX4_9BILA|nr:hypothetical protein T07_6424 [Trichinella nelsoni]